MISWEMPKLVRINAQYAPGEVNLIATVTSYCSVASSSFPIPGSPITVFATLRTVLDSLEAESLAQVKVPSFLKMAMVVLVRLIVLVDPGGNAGKSIQRAPNHPSVAKVKGWEKGLNSNNSFNPTSRLGHPNNKKGEISTMIRKESRLRFLTPYAEAEHLNLLRNDVFIYYVESSSGFVRGISGFDCVFMCGDW